MITWTPSYAECLLTSDLLHAYSRPTDLPSRYVFMKRPKVSTVYRTLGHGTHRGVSVPKTSRTVSRMHVPHYINHWVLKPMMDDMGTERWV